MSFLRKAGLTLLCLILIWVVIDLYYPYKTDISKIDAAETARMDAAMWRSYYEQKKLKLFFQSASLLRSQFHFPLLRSHIIAWHIARAAFIFKDGHTRADYEQALPQLKEYFCAVNNMAIIGFNTDSAAKTELEWWIIRRDKSISTAEWESLLAATAAVMYHKPADLFKEYARLRVKAMLLRDMKNTAITGADWGSIEGILKEAWASFAIACT